MSASGSKSWRQSLGGPRDVGGAVEQAVDEREPFIGARVVEEIAGLGGRRDLADQVEADPPEELAVVGPRGRANPPLGPFRRNCRIDPGGDAPAAGRRLL